MCLTINVIDGESVREVGHVGLLSEWGFLLGLRLSRASIIQTLDRQEESKMKPCNTICLIGIISKSHTIEVHMTFLQRTTAYDVGVPVWVCPVLPARLQTFYPGPGPLCHCPPPPLHPWCLLLHLTADPSIEKQSDTKKKKTERHFVC